MAIKRIRDVRTQRSVGDPLPQKRGRRLVIRFFGSCALFVVALASLMAGGSLAVSGCSPCGREPRRDHGALPGGQLADRHQCRGPRLDASGGRNLHGELLHQREPDVVRPRHSRRWRRSETVRVDAQRHCWNRGLERPGYPARCWYRRPWRWPLEQWSVDPEPLDRDAQHRGWQAACSTWVS